MITLIDRPVTLFGGTALVAEAEKLEARDLNAQLA